MLLEIAVPNIDDEGSPPFVIARLAETSCCPVLARRLQTSVARFVPGMQVVLIHCDHVGEVRVYGDERLALALTGIDLLEQQWVPFAISVNDGDDFDGLAVAA